MCICVSSWWSSIDLVHNLLQWLVCPPIDSWQYQCWFPCVWTGNTVNNSARVSLLTRNYPTSVSWRSLSLLCLSGPSPPSPPSLSTTHLIYSTSLLGRSLSLTSQCKVLQTAILSMGFSFGKTFLLL